MGHVQKPDLHEAVKPVLGTVVQRSTILGMSRRAPWPPGLAPPCSLEYSSCPLMGWLSILVMLAYMTFCLGSSGSSRTISQLAQAGPIACLHFAGPYLV